ncbi:ATP-binding protein, partial [candidate division KSB1 bacterium]|nr:ATP-binding protein [candidate division KSB1 bacterium]
RRVGKTVIIERLANVHAGESLLLNGEDLEAQALLSERSVASYQRLIGDKTLLLIDEAQKVPGIGAMVKLMVDHFPQLRIVLTGSSAFDLYQDLGEPLTGRKITLRIHPLALEEFRSTENLLETQNRLAVCMIFGCYPETWHYQNPKDRISYLKNLASDYLLKDLLQYDGIRNTAKLQNLLRLIAFQIGREVSFDELGRQLGLNKNTVEKYLDLLIKVFVLIRVGGFSRNLRKEVSKSSKWYFVDNGVRNVFAANFNELSLRNDTGELWENYCISERLKAISYRDVLAWYYFWRTYDQQEITWVEERSGGLHGYEFK